MDLLLQGDQEPNSHVPNLYRYKYAPVPQEADEDHVALDVRAATTPMLDQEQFWQRWRLGEFTIIPEDNRWLDMWDIVVILALLFTALLLPIEVAFFTHVPDNLQIINLVVDIIFATDIVVTFNVAFTVPSALTNDLYERSPIKIARQYAGIPCTKACSAGWFWIDFLTIFPWDQVGCKSVRYLRIFRLLRMMRLVRIVKIFGRWHSRLGTSYSTLNVLKCAAITVGVLHWLTCFWGYLGWQARDSGETTWLKAYAAGHHEGIEGFTMYDVYNLAMYYCTMTLTGVGFGDVHASGMFEVALSTITMFTTGFMWAWVVANIVNVVGNLDAYSTWFQKLNDDLNMLMSSRDLPTHLQMRARKHLNESFKVQRQRQQQETLKALSIGLQGEIAIESGADRVCNCVWYLRNLGPDVLTELVNCLYPDMYSPAEYINHKYSVSVIRRGSCWFKSRIIMRDDVIGEDMLLDSEYLRDTVCPKTLNYVEVMTLSRSDLSAVCDKFPEFSRKIRLAQVKLAACRGVVWYARQMKIQERRRKPNCDEELTLLKMLSPQDNAPRFCKPQDRIAEITARLDPMKRMLDRLCAEAWNPTSISRASIGRAPISRGVSPPLSPAASSARSIRAGRPLKDGATQLNDAGSDVLGMTSQLAWEEEMVQAAVQPEHTLQARLGSLEFLQEELRNRMDSLAQQPERKSNVTTVAVVVPAQADVFDSVGFIKCGASHGTGGGPHSSSPPREPQVEPKLSNKELLWFERLGDRLESLAESLGRHHDALEATLVTQGRHLHTIERKLSDAQGATEKKAVFEGSSPLTAVEGAKGRRAPDLAEKAVEVLGQRIDEMLSGRHSLWQEAMASTSAKMDVMQFKLEARLEALHTRLADMHLSDRGSPLQRIGGSGRSPLGSLASVSLPSAMLSQLEVDQGRLLTTIRHRAMSLEATVSSQLEDFATALRERLEAQMDGLRASAVDLVRRQSDSLKASLALQLGGLEVDCLRSSPSRAATTDFRRGAFRASPGPSPTKAGGMRGSAAREVPDRRDFFTR